MLTPLSTEVRGDFDEVLENVRRALWEQGFGVLTEVDMQSILEAKLGRITEDYVILGACNPQLAGRALQIDPTIGLLLPCNVVVRADRAEPGCVIIEAMNPQLLVEVTGDTELRAVADEVNRKLRAAIDDLPA